MEELLRRLDSEGWKHGDVIRHAAENFGFVERAAIYEIARYNDERMLRGYTRPVNRITKDLQEAGIVQAGVTPMLQPVYVDVKAAGFKIPGEVVDLLVDGPSEDDDFPATG